MGTPPEAVPSGPRYRLFDSGAVGTAAFICSPLAGAILIAVNYVRLGKAGKGVVSVALGLTATALYMLIKWNWNAPPGSLGRLECDAFQILFGIAMWICTWKVAKEEQGDAIKEHTTRGGQLDSRYTAACVGFVTLVVLVLPVLYAYQYRKSVFIGTNDRVLYSGIATKATAAALGNMLRSSEYFQGSGASVLLNKGFGSTTISFVVQDGVWNQTGMLSGFEELAREAAPAVGGLPVQVRLVNSNLEVKDASTVGEVKFDGPDGVYYEGSATKDEAQALGRRFKSMGFFKGKGANVFLTRHEDGTTLAFVVAVDGAWNNPKMISSFEAIVRHVAPTVGGLPIEMHLVNTQLQVEKDELIQ
jgi:hypothetical protein